MGDNNSLKEKIIYEAAHQHSDDVNFILSKKHIAGFFPGSEPYEGYFFVSDLEYNPVMVLTFHAYICACGISVNSTYAIVQLARGISEDPQTVFIYVLSGEILWSINTPFDWRTIQGYSINEDLQIIYEYHEGYTVWYSFDGDVLNYKDVIAHRYQHPDVSPYELNEIASNIILELTNNGFDKNDYDIAIKTLQKAESFENMSTYQLSQTYKLLGQLNEKICNYDAALNSYRKALELYDKAPVKKKIKELEKI